MMSPILHEQIENANGNGVCHCFWILCWKSFHTMKLWEIIRQDEQVNTDTSCHTAPLYMVFNRNMRLFTLSLTLSVYWRFLLRSIPPPIESAVDCSAKRHCRVLMFPSFISLAEWYKWSNGVRADTGGILNGSQPIRSKNQNEVLYKYDYIAISFQMTINDPLHKTLLLSEGLSTVGVTIDSLQSCVLCHEKFKCVTTAWWWCDWLWMSRTHGSTQDKWMCFRCSFHDGEQHRC